MTSAKIIWTDAERYVGEAGSHHSVVMDTAAEKTASTPMELVLIALCGCTASDVVGILRKKREAFTHLEVRAHGERASGYPAVYTEIKLTYRVGGKVSRKAMEDAVRLSKEKYCSVSAMLEKTAKITAEIEYDSAPEP
jgi:putative redox protein